MEVLQANPPVLEMPPSPKDDNLMSHLWQDCEQQQAEMKMILSSTGQ